MPPLSIWPHSAGEAALEVHGQYHCSRWYFLCGRHVPCTIQFPLMVTAYKTIDTYSPFTLLRYPHFTCARVCVCVCLVLSHMWLCVPTTTFKVQNSSLIRRRITHIALLRPHPPLSVTPTPPPTNLLSTSKMLYMES